MVSFLVNTRSIMHCIFGYANPMRLGPRNQHILQKIKYQIKEVVYTLKTWLFIFRNGAFFLVPKKMGSLLIHFWETAHPPPPPSQHFALSLWGGGVRQFPRNVWWSNMIHKMFSKTIINFLAICQDSCWAPNFKAWVLGHWKSGYGINYRSCLDELVLTLASTLWHMLRGRRYFTSQKTDQAM